MRDTKRRNHENLNLAYAKIAIEYVKIALPLGSVNKKPDELKENYVNNCILLGMIRDIADSMLSTANSFLHAINILADQYEKGGVGNCFEQCIVAFRFLKRILLVDNVYMYQIPESEHKYLVIGDVICDPWADAFYPVSEFKAQQKTCGEIEYADIVWLTFEKKGKTPVPYLCGTPSLISETDIYKSPVIQNSNYFEKNIFEPKIEFITSALFQMSSYANDIPFPSELDKLVKDSRNIANCFNKGFISRRKLIDLFHNAFYVLDSLRCYNIFLGICNDYITIEQLSQLTKEQVFSIQHKFYNKELQEKVEEYLKENWMHKLWWKSLEEVEEVKENEAHPNEEFLALLFMVQMTNYMMQHPSNSLKLLTACPEKKMITLPAWEEAKKEEPKLIFFSEFFHKTKNEFLINHRHENPELQHEYDKRFGIILKN